MMAKDVPTEEPKRNLTNYPIFEYRDTTKNRTMKGKRADRKELRVECDNLLAAFYSLLAYFSLSPQSTVTAFARFLGVSGFIPFMMASS